VAQDPAARAEILLREAHVLRMRRQFAEAETKVRAALDVHPESVTGLEMLGDLLAEKGSLEEAAAKYKYALELAPGRAAIEEKHARLALELGEQQHQRSVAEMLLQNPRALGGPQRRKRNPILAFFLSSLWPGLGQLYNHEYGKGLLMAGGGLITFLLSGDALFRMLFAVSGSRVSPSASGSVFGVIFTCLWIYSLIDAPIRAQKLSEGKSRDAGLL
jgi:tetratricopeptide (TPR) repeat protein